MHSCCVSGMTLTTLSLPSPAELLYTVTVWFTKSLPFTSSKYCLPTHCYHLFLHPRSLPGHFSCLWKPICASGRHCHQSRSAPLTSDKAACPRRTRLCARPHIQSYSHTPPLGVPLPCTAQALPELLERLGSGSAGPP